MEHPARKLGFGGCISKNRSRVTCLWNCVVGGGGADDTAEACFEAESHSLLRHEPTAGEILKVMFCTTVLAIPKRFDTAFRNVG